MVYADSSRDALHFRLQCDRPDSIFIYAVRCAISCPNMVDDSNGVFRLPAGTPSRATTMSSESLLISQHDG
jgi:hypothetical protein